MALAAGLLSVSTLSNASLIINGSFEQLTFGDQSSSIGAVHNTELQSFNSKKRGWDVFSSLPGWTTISGSGIELQKNVVTKSQQGTNHVELDSHRRGTSNSVMTQTVNSLTIGHDYLLEFYYKPRTNALNDNGINVYWYNSSLDFDLKMNAMFIADSTRSVTPNWQKQSVHFTATASSMDLSFGSFGRQNTLGGLIDNVSLVDTTVVSEPSMLAILFAPLSFLFFRRRKQQQK